VTPRPDDLPYKGDTVVGNDVWVGYNALLLSGVKVGDGAIVVAGSVVTGDLPPCVVVGGNPAKVVKRRFPDEVVAELLAIRWWDWAVGKITRNLHAIVGADLSVLRGAV
jgi:virginiamycin A acetyltransferase